MEKLFIVFEGIDGSGSTTQAELLKDYFMEKLIKAVVTSEPSNGPIGHLIKESMKGRVYFTKDNKKFDQQMAYLFAADRHDHLYNQVDGIYRLIEKGYIVISTRYYFSSLAYHCDNDSDFEFVKNINEKFPDPDLMIYLDNTVELSLERMKHRSFCDEYENEYKLRQVKNNYKKIISEYDGLVLQVDSSNTKEYIHSDIVRFIETNLLNKWNLQK